MSEVQKHQGQATDHFLSGRNLQKKLSYLMECPHCHKEIPGKKCAECGATIPLESHYCMNCGSNLKEDIRDRIDHDDAFDLENRVLCPDGTCTGIIVNGKCTECGKPYKGGEVKEN